MSNIYAMADTWNNAATVFTALQMNVTDTASNVASKLMDLQIGGVSRFAVGKDIGVAYDGSANPYIRLTSSRGAGSAFDLVQNPNGGTTIGVPTFRPATANSRIALDLCPNGTATDIGYGLAWSDICSTDQITSGNLATSTLHIGIGNVPSLYTFIGSAEYTAGTLAPLKFGMFNGDTPAWTFSHVINTDSTVTFLKSIGLGNAAPVASAFAAIAAGTTAAAQINFAGSTAPTTPNNGDFWFDGTNFKARVGGVTKTFTIA
jgi:hypothetical protein